MPDLPVGRAPGRPWAGAPEQRAVVRQWLAEHLPDDWRGRLAGAPEHEYIDFQRWWFAELRDGGWLVPHWPEAWGGGFTVEEQAVLFDELAAAGAPRLEVHFLSLYHAPSTLLGVGTPGQQTRHLPGILRGEVFCQGFSEPDAGSDLAALRTQAVADGDEYVVNGQKVWTSYAGYADWCLLLARTDPDAPKHRGISYFLMDMRSPGVEVRPIRQATGAAEFCELFLTDVRIPRANLLGDEHAGWQVAGSTLAAERGLVNIETAARLAAGIDRLVDELRRLPGEAGGTAIEDPTVRDRVAGIVADVRVLRLLCTRMVRSMAAGGSSGGGGPEADASLIKLLYSELLQKAMEAATDVSGLAAQLAQPLLLGAGWETGYWLMDYVGSWSQTVGGGTTQIQRTVIGERALGLPREQR